MTVRSLIARHGGRWLRWTAVLLGVLAVLSALLQLLHREPARPALVPAVVTRHALRPGEVLRAADVEIVAREAGSLRGAGPAEIMPFVRAEDAVGHVALRPLRRGEAVTPENAVPVLQYYGVSVRVPAGMRAVNLVVPSAATFGGELAPRTRVDLLGAFAVGRDRAAAVLLSPGIVLRILADRTPRPGGTARLNGPGVEETSSSAIPSVQIEIAIPEDREREVALAQAFGRIFLAVHPAGTGVPHPAPSAVLQLERYLEFPPEARSLLAPLPPIQPVLPGLPAGSAGAGARRRGENPSPPAAPHTGAPTSGGPSGPTLWPVEVIGGSERSVEIVPRAGDVADRRTAPLAPGRRAR